MVLIPLFSLTVDISYQLKITSFIHLLSPDNRLARDPICFKKRFNILAYLSFDFDFSFSLFLLDETLLIIIIMKFLR